MASTTCGWIHAALIRRVVPSSQRQSTLCIHVYERSGRCYVYLDDVKGNDQSMNHEVVPTSRLAKSCWFTKGWTLQELLAPSSVYFYTRDWKPLGSLAKLARQVSAITRISVEILKREKRISAVPIAERISWAGPRQTSRKEDEAYSLMGIFGINMPIIYGEGDRAFRRLQLKIMQTSNDHTLFAWHDSHLSGMLANSPRSFLNLPKYQIMDFEEYILHFGIRSAKLNYSITNTKIHIKLPLLPVPKFSSLYVALLACTSRSFVGIYLKENQGSTHPHFHHFYRVAFNGSCTASFSNEFVSGLCRHKDLSKTIWISDPPIAISAAGSGLLRGSRLLRFEIALHDSIDHNTLICWPSIKHKGRLGLGFHLYEGRMHVGSLRHETIRINDLRMDLSFGEAGGRIWFCNEHVRGFVTSLGEDNKLEAKHKSFEFMVGEKWQDPSSEFQFLDDRHEPRIIKGPDFEISLELIKYEDPDLFDKGRDLRFGGKHKGHVSRILISPKPGWNLNRAIPVGFSQLSTGDTVKAKI